MMKRILGNLWLWVTVAFLLVIAAWVWTIMIAKDFDYKPIPDGEQLERQAPTPPSSQN